jgi:uncharacterized protein HemX
MNVRSPEPRFPEESVGMNDLLTKYPPMPPPATTRTKNRAGWIVAVSALSLALVILGTVGAVLYAGQRGDITELENTIEAREEAIATQKGDIAALNEELDSASADLGDARAAVNACRRAAEVMRKKSNAGVWLFNQVLYAANRWAFTYDFYLYDLIDGYGTRVPMRAGAAQKVLNACYDSSTGQFSAF